MATASEMSAPAKRIAALWISFHRRRDEFFDKSLRSVTTSQLIPTPEESRTAEEHRQWLGEQLQGTDLDGIDGLVAKHNRLILMESITSVYEEQKREYWSLWRQHHARFSTVGSQQTSTTPNEVADLRDLSPAGPSVSFPPFSLSECVAVDSVVRRALEIRQREMQQIPPKTPRENSVASAEKLLDLSHTNSVSLPDPSLSYLAIDIDSGLKSRSATRRCVEDPLGFHESDASSCGAVRRESSGTKEPAALNQSALGEGLEAQGWTLRPNHYSCSRRAMLRKALASKKVDTLSLPAVSSMHEKPRSPHSTGIVEILLPSTPPSHKHGASAMDDSLASAHGTKSPMVAAARASEDSSAQVLVPLAADSGSVYLVVGTSESDAQPVESASSAVPAREDNLLITIAGPETTTTPSKERSPKGCPASQRHSMEEFAKRHCHIKPFSPYGALIDASTQQRRGSPCDPGERPLQSSLTRSPPRSDGAQPRSVSPLQRPGSTASRPGSSTSVITELRIRIDQQRKQLNADRALVETTERIAALRGTMRRKNRQKARDEEPADYPASRPGSALATSEFIREGSTCITRVVNRSFTPQLLASKAPDTFVPPMLRKARPASPLTRLRLAGYIPSVAPESDGSSYNNDVNTPKFDNAEPRHETASLLSHHRRLRIQNPSPSSSWKAKQSAVFNKERSALEISCVVASRIQQANEAQQLRGAIPISGSRNDHLRHGSRNLKTAAQTVNASAIPTTSNVRKATRDELEFLQHLHATKY